MKALLRSGFIIVMLVISQTAFANQKVFKGLIDTAQKNCPELNCSQEFFVRPLTEAETSSLNSVMMLRIHQIAFDLNQLWGDTILEGDYEVTGEMHLEILSGVFINGKLSGFRIQYSQPAKDLLKDQTGKITEKGFVSLNLTEAFVDEFSMAKFFAGN
jgi:hypothetical protein